VVAREDQPGDRRLVAYYTGSAAITADLLRTRARTRLPEHMVPAAYVRLEALPLTSNGKLDRNALPAPEGDAYGAHTYQAPVGHVERSLATIWSELLQVPRIGRDDNFFELGGHSLLAVTLIERMRRVGIHADVRAIFTTPTLASLAATAGSESGDVVVPPNGILPGTDRITPEMLPLVDLDQAAIDRIVANVPGGAANVQDIYPLAPLQEGILYHHLLARQGDVYLLPNLQEFERREDLDHFLQVFQALVERHDILRTSVVWEGLDEPVQVVHRRATLAVDTLVLDPADGAAVEQLQARFNPRHHRIDVRVAPLVRGYLTHDPARGRWILLLLVHHLAFDHTTLEVLLEEARLIASGRVGELPPAAPFRNFVAQARLGTTREEHEAFFRQMLGDVDGPTAPFGLVDVHGDGTHVGQSKRKLSRPLALSVRQHARRLGVSSASVLHLAWAMVLSRVSERRDVVFGTVLFGRMQGGSSAHRALGVFINTLPLRIDVGEQGVLDALRATHGLLAQLIRYEHAPLSLAQRCSRVPSPAPLFSSLLNYRHSHGADVSADEPGRAPEEAWMQERTNYPVTLSVDDLGEDFLLTAQVSSPVAPERVCVFMETAIVNLLEALRDAPHTALARVDVLPAEERARVLVEWNRTAEAFPSGTCLHELFEAQAARSPEAVAVVFGEERVSYGELNERANRLGNYLLSVGVKPDTRVGVCAERGVEMVVSLLATLKAGGAYVPLDPSYPRERLSYLLDDSAPVLVLTDPAGRAAVSMIARQLVVDVKEDESIWSRYPDTNPKVAGLTSRNLAYVIYTSGSTGQPKGAMNEHRSVVNRITWMQRRYDGSRDVVLQKTPFSFDVSVWEFFWPLSSGGRLVMANPGAHKDPSYLAEIVQAQGISTVHFVPSMLQIFLECEGASACLGLTRVVCSGEALPATLVERFHQRLPGVALHNLYGPTEAAIEVTAWTYDPDDARTSIQIGRPIANARIYILDATREPVPMGVSGEIYIAGVPVGRGYLKRPELTQERFLEDPFSDEPEARMYRTGDIGRWLPDGSIEYLGRNDFQVKVRGFRIELGEIEARLTEVAGVHEAVVVAREDRPGDQRLVAYYTGALTEVEALRSHVREQLPEYMVPAAYVHLDALPLTPSGKLDRRALPAPEGEAYAAPRGYEAPEGELEQTLAEIWRELLNVPRVGRADDFFQLGGHSLVAVQLTSRVERALNVSVGLRELLEHPTLAEFARAMSSELASQPRSSLLPIRRHGTLPPVFVIHAGGGDVEYARVLAERLDPRIPVYGLAASGLVPGEEPLTSVPEMAARYVAAIREVQGHGPYRLMGYSAGGAIAYEMGGQLLAMGEDVGFVGLIDAYASLEEVKSIRDLMRIVQTERGSGRDETAMLHDLVSAGLPVEVKNDFADLSSSGDFDGMTELLRTVGGLPATLEVAAMRRIIRVRLCTTEATFRYRPAFLPLPVTLFQAAERGVSDPTLGWGAVLGDRLRTVPIGGTHQTLVHPPFVDRLAEAIGNLLADDDAARDRRGPGMDSR
jgi:amino acid adenylation domain-containing protein